MHTIKLFKWFNRHRRVLSLSAMPVMLLMVAGVGVFVYATGGIKYVYSHSMYVPIVLSGMIYGVKGGVIIAVMGGMVLGPYMPIDVVTGEMQQTVNWLYRAGFFILIGALSGIASDTVRAYIGHLYWLSRHDVATRLPNRLALLDDLSDISRRPSPANHILLVLSLHSATELKAAFGHDVIETIISQTAQRFGHVLPRRDQIYRADTEEVSALISPIETTLVDDLLGALNRTVRTPYVYQGIPVHIDSRIGYVQFHEVDDEPGQYLQQAESALDVAHKSLLERVRYQPSLRLATRDNMSLMAELMKALEQKQLALHYQPKLALNSGEIYGVEALMRWQHPERGTISPATFIPCAEQTTLIHLMTHFALNEAMQTARYFQEQGMQMPVAVNISAHNLSQPDFADRLFDMLEEHGLSGNLLELEVTESALVRDMTHTISELNRLAEAGIIISVDDFGTGYSSLQYLHKLPISHLKIDQSFINRLPDDEGAMHIIQAAISLAHKMQMQAIAEGVENAGVMRFLNSIGCDFAQGYFISRPVERDQFVAWYQQYQGRFDWRHFN